MIENSNVNAETAVNETTTENVNSEQIDDVVTFDDLLKDPNYQKEFDKKVAKAIDTATKNAKTKWEKDFEAKRAESERLAQMSVEEKHQFEMNKAVDERDSAIRQLNAYRLKDAAIQYASDKGIDSHLVDLIQYENEDADSVKEKLNNIEAVVKKAIEQGINEKLRQMAPKNYNQAPKTTGQEYLDKKYGANPFYNKKK